MTNPFVHVELNSPDPEKAKAFYAKLFQWQLEDPQLACTGWFLHGDQSWRRHRRRNHEAGDERSRRLDSLRSGG